jgi:RNA polymerase sigma factor (sigma-70 family)
VQPSVAYPALNPALIGRGTDPAAASPALRALTGGLARGDDAAWAEFHREYGPAIFRQLLAATRGDHDLASEALQQTYLRVSRHARPCDSETMFNAWLRILGRSALGDCRRRRRSFWEMLSRRQEDPITEDDAPDEDDRLNRALDQALAELDPGQRALLEAKYFARADVRTLAARYAITEKAAESRLSRARAALRERLLAILAIPHE